MWSAIAARETELITAAEARRADRDDPDRPCRRWRSTSRRACSTTGTTPRPAPSSPPGRSERGRRTQHGLPVRVQRRQRVAGHGADQLVIDQIPSPAEQAHARAGPDGLRLLLQPGREPDPRRLLGRSPPPECSVPGNYRGGPTVYYTCHHYGAFNTEPRMASYLGIAAQQIPQKHYFGTFRTFPDDNCDWSWSRAASRSASTRPTSASRSSKVPTATAGCAWCPPGAARCSRR